MYMDNNTKKITTTAMLVVFNMSDIWIFGEEKVGENK